MGLLDNSDLLEVLNALSQGVAGFGQNYRTRRGNAILAPYAPAFGAVGGLADYQANKINRQNAVRQMGKLAGMSDDDIEALVGSGAEPGEVLKFSEAQQKKQAAADLS